MHILHILDLVCMLVCAIDLSKLHVLRKVRGVVDAAGVQGNMGLLQIRKDTGFGTVCGTDSGAADLICRVIGYDHGTTGSNPCSSYGGTDLCGELGSPVAMQNLSCTGGSLNLEGSERLIDMILAAILKCAGAIGMCQNLFVWGMNLMLLFFVERMRLQIKCSRKEWCDCWHMMGHQARMEKDG